MVKNKVRSDLDQSVTCAERMQRPGLPSSTAQALKAIMMSLTSLMKRPGKFSAVEFWTTALPQKWVATKRKKRVRLIMARLRALEYSIGRPRIVNKWSVSATDLCSWTKVVRPFSSRASSRFWRSMMAKRLRRLLSSNLETRLTQSHMLTKAEGGRKTVMKLKAMQSKLTKWWEKSICCDESYEWNAAVNSSAASFYAQFGSVFPPKPTNCSAKTSSLLVRPWQQAGQKVENRDS